MSPFNEKDLSALVGNMLRWGVVLSMSVVILGLGLYIFHHSGEPTAYKNFMPEKLPAIKDMLGSALQGDASSIILVGVMMLIATPVMRIVFALVGFALEKDKLYVGISIIILCIILFSVLFGAVE